MTPVVKLQSIAKPNKSEHPTIKVMVQAALVTLHDPRKGTSIQAIKKFIEGQYYVDCEKLSPHLKKYFKSAVESGEIVQVTGKGMSGSFKLPPKSKKKQT